MIELQNVSIGFNDQAIFHQINLTIEPQSTVAIMGPSGIGKTTLGRVILGLESNFSGVRKVDGQVLPVLQSPTLLPWRTAIDNLVLIAQVTPEAALEAMASVGLGDKAQHYPSQLSLGQQRRLSLARAMLAAPDYLILDEPFASLDPATSEQMIALTRATIERLGCGLLLITHDATEAQALCEHCYIMQGQPANLTPLNP